VNEEERLLHDLQNALFTVAAQCELLEKETSGSVYARVIRIQVAAKQMSRMIREKQAMLQVKL